jgi:hypothetical protein
MTLSSRVDNAFQALAIDEHRRPFQPSVWEQSPNTDGQILEQVWFAGVHSNVGGSYPDCGLSDITLTWMLAKAELSGLAINHECLVNLNHPQPNPLGKLYDSQTMCMKSPVWAIMSVPWEIKLTNSLPIPLRTAWLRAQANTVRKI